MDFDEFAAHICRLALECGYDVQAINGPDSPMIWDHVLLQTEFETETWEVAAQSQRYGLETVIQLSSCGIPVPSDLGERRTLAMALMRRNSGLGMGLWGFETVYGIECQRVYSHVVLGALNALTFTVAVDALLEELRWWRKAARRAEEG